MSNVSPLPQAAERKQRRLHLREVSENEPEVPSTVGGRLRAARFDRGEEKNAVAAALKMRMEHLDAIESNDFARLPGRTYAVGFIRAYARHLDLDVESVLQQFKDETASADYAKPVDLVFPEAQAEIRLPNGSLLILALIVITLVYGLSYLTMPERKAATAARADSVIVIDEPQAVTAQAQSQTPAAEATTVETATTDAAPQTETQNASFVEGDAKLPETKLPDALPPIASPESVLDTPMQTVAYVIADNDFGVAAQPASNEEGPSRVTLTALQPTYIQVRERTGKKLVLVSRLLNPGESYSAPDRGDLIMQTGNAGGLQVEVDGRVLGVMGRSGEVIARVPLDPSYFLEHLAVTQ